MASENDRSSATQSPSFPQRALQARSDSSPLLSFSINRILGLNGGVPPDSTCFERKLPSTPRIRSTCYNRGLIDKDREQSSPHFEDRTSGSDGDCESDGDQVKVQQERPPSKKRQRTTFSPIEVWELERVFKRRPFLMPEDEEELVQRLGISAKSLKYWFQNRRAKLRRDALKMVHQSRQASNQFGSQLRPINHPTPYASAVVPIRDQHCSDDIRRPVAWEGRLNKSRPELSPPLSRPLPIKSNRINTHPAFFLPMFHPDQFKHKPDEATEPVFRRSFAAISHTDCY